MNFLWLLLYLGMATDDALHLINQGREVGNDWKNALRRTGNAICFTSLTTIVSFGSMAFGPFPIMQQAGILIALAMGWELIASLWILPALLALFYPQLAFLRRRSYR